MLILSQKRLMSIGFIVTFIVTLIVTLYRHFFADKTKSAHRSSSDRWAPLQYVQLFLHDLQHHSGSQFEAVLEDQAIRYCLKLPDAIRVLLKQLLLLIRHGCPELFFISADQFLQFLMLRTGRGIVLCRLDIAVPEFFKDSHATSSP